MKNKLIFRILGAIASALIIVSVFIPFVSVTGYSTSLWESFGSANTLYLPIMIIVFGAIGVIFFALNIKTEFAYMSTGAITFFLVMQTIDILNQGVFNTLSFGYYFLAVGAIITGLMAFLVNLKSNKKEEKIEPVQQMEQPSMLDQIDRLYNDQTITQNQISPIQPIENNIEPISVQPIETIMPVEPINPVMQDQSVQEVAQVTPGIQATPIPVEQQPINNQPVNPVVQEFTAPQVSVQPMVQEQPVSVPEPMPVQNLNIPQSVNPVVQDFATAQVSVQPMVQEQPVSVPEPIPVEDVSTPEPMNPVVQEFTNPGSTIQSQSNTNELDIFGQ